MASITVLAPAKLNLTLDVLGRREDGYHEIKMVMQSVSLADRVTLAVEPGEGISASADLNFLPHDQRNLAVAAALRLREAVGGEWGKVSITLNKRVPVCAGMAGGSSDAAAVLRGLNTLLKLELSPGELAKIGEKVGSDVPYCVLGGTALAEGRGERITPLPPLPPCSVVLAKPEFPVSTPELFARIDSRQPKCHPDTAGILKALEAGDLPGVARRLFNVFEEVLPDRKRMRVEELKGELLRCGGLGAGMSGTGPTVFGLFQDAGEAEAAGDVLKKCCQEVYVCNTIG